MQNLKSFIEEKQRVKFSNVDNNNRLKPMDAARWFQDIFLKQDETLGIERTNSFTWILLNYDMNIYKYAKLGDNVCVETYPYSFNKFYGNRILALKDENGETLIEAKTRWLFVEKDTFKIKKVTKEVAKVYDIEEISKGRGFEVDKIDENLFEDVIPNPLQIRHMDLDTNNHVNNALYFSYFYEYVDKEILDNYLPYKIQVTYKKQITIDDKPIVYSKNTIEDTQKYTNIKISNEENEIYTLIKILWKKKDEH